MESKTWAEKFKMKIKSKTLIPFTIKNDPVIKRLVKKLEINLKTF